MHIYTDEDCEYSALDEFATTEHSKYPKDWMMDIKNKSISINKEGNLSKSPLKVNFQGEGNKIITNRENMQNDSIYLNDVAEGVESSFTAINNPVIFNYNDLSKIYERKDSSSKSLANSCVMGRKPNSNDHLMKSNLSNNLVTTTQMNKKASEANILKTNFLLKLRKAEELSQKEIANSQIKKMIYDLVLEFNHNSNLGISYKDYCILQDLVVSFIPKLSLHPFVDESKTFKLRQTPHCINLLNSNFLNLNSASKAERRRSISICRGRRENDENEEAARLQTCIQEGENMNRSPPPKAHIDFKTTADNEPFVDITSKDLNGNNVNRDHEKLVVFLPIFLWGRPHFLLINYLISFTIF